MTRDYVIRIKVGKELREKHFSLADYFLLRFRLVSKFPSRRRIGGSNIGTNWTGKNPKSGLEVGKFSLGSFESIENMLFLFIGIR